MPRKVKCFYAGAVCCACGILLDPRKGCGLALLDQAAPGDFPTWGNCLLPAKYDRGPRAVAFVCRECARTDAPVRHAITKAGDTWEYTPVEQLEDLPPITTDMLVDWGEKGTRYDPDKNGPAQ